MHCGPISATHDRLTSGARGKQPLDLVVGEGRGRDGRKTFTASTLYDADGRVVATAEHTWIAVDPAMFGGRAPSSD